MTKHLINLTIVILCLTTDAWLDPIKFKVRDLMHPKAPTHHTPPMTKTQIRNTA